jgi:hypothetical protein
MYLGLLQRSKPFLLLHVSESNNAMSFLNVEIKAKCDNPELSGII